MIPVVVSEEVAAVLGAEAGLVRTGELFDKPDYECLKCYGLSDLRQDQAAAVVFLGPEAVSLALIHAACGPSATYPAEEFKTHFPPPDSSGWGKAGPFPDETFCTVVQLDDVVYPALVVVPGDNIRAVPAGSINPIDSAVEDMRGHGFAPVDFGGAQRPAELPRWAIRVDRGRLTQISKPGGPWWASEEPLAVPQEWREVARSTRQCLLMITTARLPEGELLGMRAALSVAAQTGQLVGALVPVRGTLS